MTQQKPQPQGLTIASKLSNKHLCCHRIWPLRLPAPASTNRKLLLTILLSLLRSTLFEADSTFISRAYSYKQTPSYRTLVAHAAAASKPSKRPAFFCNSPNRSAQARSKSCPWLFACRYQPLPSARCWCFCLSQKRRTAVAV
jgi:hypothetical protein